MTSLKTNAFVFAVAALVLGGCGMLKKKQPEPEASASAAVLAPPPVTTPVAPSAAPPEPEVKVADDAISTPEDFEDEAFEKVTDKTYKVELGALKKEIEAK